MHFFSKNALSSRCDTDARMCATDVHVYACSEWYEWRFSRKRSTSSLLSVTRNRTASVSAATSLQWCCAYEENATICIQNMSCLLCMHAKNCPVYSLRVLSNARPADIGAKPTEAIGPSLACSREAETRGQAIDADARWWPPRERKGLNHTPMHQRTNR